MKKNIYGYLLCLMALLLPTNSMAASFTEVPAEFTGPTWYDYRDTSFSYEGKGTLNNPIVITTAEQLAQFSYLYNENPSRFEKKVVVLGADINLNRTEGGKRVQWIPIGYNSNYASIVFLGVDTRNMGDGGWTSAQPHSISGLYINADYSKSQYETFGQPVHDSAFGLFAAISRSFIGYLNIKDAEVTIDYSNSVSLLNSYVGLLTGESNSPVTSTANISDGVNTVYVPSAIDGVSVEGNIQVTGTGRTTYKECVGGISGKDGSMGISHSTFKGKINVNNATCVGGITGYVYGSDVIDCAADADITSNSTIVPQIGGIIGLNDNSYQAYSQSRKVEACVSMGSIKCSKDNQQRHVVGGICGYLGQHVTMLGCSSTMLICSYGNVGGLVGRMQKINGSGDASDGTYYYRDSKIECCSFGGHIDGSLAHTDDKGQVTNFDTSITDNYVGGFCGYLEWDDNHEHILRCLFVGTMMNSDWNFPGSESVTVGYGTNIGSTVTYCYYDNNMYTRKACPDNQENATIIGLPTKDLITGTSTKIGNFLINESDPYGFKLVKGSYPIPYSNNTVEDQQTVCEQNNSPALSDLAKRMFSWDEMNTQNSVYAAGAHLCAMPVSFSDGDAADYFVAELTVPTKTTTWQEVGTDRDISLVSECFFPESECISVKDKTATANLTGNCIITIEGTSKVKATPSTAYDRPTPIGGSKILGLRAETQKVWSGDEANVYAGGSGTAADPYLIKNGEQLIHAIKHNSEGQFFKQICDITICRKDDTSLITMENLKNSTQPVSFSGSYEWDSHGCEWKATYDGNGHFVKGLLLMNYFGYFNAALSLFGNVGTNGTIKNLGVIDSWIDSFGAEGHSPSFGMIASEVSGEINNCLTQGIDASGRPCGGICAYVKSGGKVEDCISAVYTLSSTPEVFTPFVAYDNTDNTGTISNCLAVNPIRLTSDISIADMSCINNCYWLKGYGIDNAGMTLDEIGSALGSRSRWTWVKGFFPTLKTFKDKDIATLMATPIRTDKTDDHLLGFTTMLEFEPGRATWTNVHGTDYIEVDSDLGVIAPKEIMPTEFSSSGLRHPVEYICSTLKNAFYYIPMFTNNMAVEKGITFVDSNAEAACIAAFDSDNDGKLSLTELRAVTTEQTLHAFNTEIGQQIVRFPEFRFFKSVTTLTTQLNGLAKLEEVSLPYNLTTIGGKDGGEYITPFDGCTSLTKMIIPAHVSTVEPGAFYLSSVDSIFVDSLNTTYVSRGGLLYSKNDELVSYPNGRSGEEIVLPGTIESILEGAIYKVDGLRKIYFDTTDYETVADLEEGGIVSDDGSLIDVYICDATYGSVLYNSYLDDDSWEEYVDADKLHYYYPLKIGSAKAATLYIGFDTELPEGLRSYIVTESVFNETDKTAYLKRMSNEIPNRSPIVIFADAPGTYRLYPLDSQLTPWNMYVNKLNGVGRDGMVVNQSDSDRGSILTLGRNSNGELGFFYYMSTEKIPPYRAYLTYEWVTSANPYFLFQIIDDEATGINGTSLICDHEQLTNDNAWYTISGRRLTGKPSTKGVYIHNGKKMVVK